MPAIAHDSPLPLSHPLCARKCNGRVVAGGSVVCQTGSLLAACYVIEEMHLKCSEVFSECHQELVDRVSIDIIYSHGSLRIPIGR